MVDPTHARTVPPNLEQLNLEQLKRQAKELLKAHRSGEAGAAPRLESHLARYAGLDEKDRAAYPLSLSEAQRVIAGENGFPSWPKLKAQAEAQAGVAGQSAFERAVACVIGGEAAGLKALLEGEPSLVRARSRSSHRATLLHYVGANGVEDELQKTPPNAVEIARILLDAGAEVDALAETYGGGPRQTTLNMLVSSVHPFRAGLQVELVEVLVGAGAAVEGLEGDGYPLRLALDFGYTAAARALAARGARVDSVEKAAGLGQVERLAELADEVLEDNALERALVLAARNEQSEALGALLERGAAIDAQPDGDGTALHAAILWNRPAAVRRLVEAGAGLAVKHRQYGATPLDFASYNGRAELVEYLVGRDPADVDVALCSAVGQGHGQIVGTLLRAGADAGPALEEARRGGDKAMIERLEAHGAAGNRDSANP